MNSILIGLLALCVAGPAMASGMNMASPQDAQFYSSGSSSSSSSSSAGDHGAPSGSNSGNDRRDTPLGGTPGVELPALVVPMVSEGRQAGYFYLTMALEVRGDDWAVREKVPYIQDALVRYVYAHPIPAGMSHEEALDVLGVVVVAIARDIMQNDQVIGIIYRDVSTGF